MKDNYQKQSRYVLNTSGMDAATTVQQIREASLSLQTGIELVPDHSHSVSPQFTDRDWSF
jgi:hypothetical protein